MPLGMDPFDAQVYKTWLNSRPNTHKEFCILHISRLDKQMTEFVRRKRRLAALEANIGRARVAEIDKFKEKLLNLFHREAGTRKNIHIFLVYHENQELFSAV